MRDFVREKRQIIFIIAEIDRPTLDYVFFIKFNYILTNILYM